MIASIEELLHREIQEEALQGESCTRSAISPVIDHQGEVVNLEHEAEVQEGSNSASNQHV